MFIPELKNYRIRTYFDLPNVFAVGWLDNQHEYLRGEVENQIIERLWQLIETSTDSFDLHANRGRGIHLCNFCGGEISRPRNVERPTVLGLSELWIPSGKIWYAAPTLIVHYIETHGYQPPRVFLDAVLSVDMTKRHVAQEAYNAICEPLMKQFNPLA